MAANIPTVGTVNMPAALVRERIAAGVPGMPVLVLSLVALLRGTGLLTRGIVQTGHAGGGTAGPVVIIVSGLLIILGGLAMCGLTAVAPGQARVVQLFGRYSGTIRTTGLRWVNPFARRHKVSTRIRNHETAVAKVNDADGNPIEIAAVVVWQVDDTARTVYAVDDFVAFVGMQTETAVRHIATSYPYDAHGAGQLTFRDNAEEITEKLSAEIATRVAPAGVTVIESWITRLAYAPEVA